MGQVTSVPLQTLSAHSHEIYQYTFEEDQDTALLCTYSYHVLENSIVQCIDSKNLIFIHSKIQNYAAKVQHDQHLLALDDKINNTKVCNNNSRTQHGAKQKEEYESIVTAIQNRVMQLNLQKSNNSSSSKHNNNNSSSCLDSKVSKLGKFLAVMYRPFTQADAVAQLRKQKQQAQQDQYDSQQEVDPAKQFETQGACSNEEEAICCANNNGKQIVEFLIFLTEYGDIVKHNITLNKSIFYYSSKDPYDLARTSHGQNHSIIRNENKYLEQVFIRGTTGHMYSLGYQSTLPNHSNAFHYWIFDIKSLDMTEEHMNVTQHWQSIFKNRNSKKPELPEQLTHDTAFNDEKQYPSELMQQQRVLFAWCYCPNRDSLLVHGGCSIKNVDIMHNIGQEDMLGDLWELKLGNNDGKKLKWQKWCNSAENCTSNDMGNLCELKQPKNRAKHKICTVRIGDGTADNNENVALVMHGGSTGRLVMVQDDTYIFYFKTKLWLRVNFDSGSIPKQVQQLTKLQLIRASEAMCIVNSNNNTASVSACTGSYVNSIMSGSRLYAIDNNKEDNINTVSVHVVRFTESIAMMMPQSLISFCPKGLDKFCNVVIKCAT